LYLKEQFEGTSERFRRRGLSAAKMLSLTRHAFSQRFASVRILSSANYSAISRNRLLSTLAILEQRDGQLLQGSLNTLTAAKKIGGSIHGFIAGTHVSAACEEAAKVDGVDQIIKIENEIYEKVGRLFKISTSIHID